MSDAILQGNNQQIKKELGDLLLHILFYAKIGEEKSAFTLKDICDALAEKLIYRHPHIFGTEQAQTSQEVEKNWEKLKLKEKEGNKTILSGVPSSLPSIIKAHRIQDKARSAGFDWEKKEDVWKKVQEEISELTVEMSLLKSSICHFGLLFSFNETSLILSLSPSLPLH